MSTETINDRVQRWLCEADTGISSKTLVTALTGIPLCREYDIPYDPSDFMRCRTAFQYFPDLSFKLGIVVDKFPYWKPFVDNWNKLNDLFLEDLKDNVNSKSGYIVCERTYDFMQELVKEARVIKETLQKVVEKEE